MAEYGQEITNEENKRRLLDIELFDGRCPVCKECCVERLDSGWSIDEPATYKFIYYCDKCGVVAREYCRPKWMGKKRWEE